MNWNRRKKLIEKYEKKKIEWLIPELVHLHFSSRRHTSELKIEKEKIYGKKIIWNLKIWSSGAFEIDSAVRKIVQKFNPRFVVLVKWNRWKYDRDIYIDLDTHENNRKSPTFIRHQSRLRWENESNSNFSTDQQNENVVSAAKCDMNEN